MYEYGNADLTQARQQSPLHQHVLKTYAWMFLGLLVTFVTAVVLNVTYLSYAIAFMGWLPFALLIAKLALVVFLTSRLHTFSVTTARVIFLVYALLTGIVFAPILLIYDAQSAILVFGVAAVFFGLMAGAGLITKRNVSGFAPIIMVGLISLLILTLVSWFVHLPALDTMICFLGLFLFMGITTYDAKKTKDLYYSYEGNAQMLDKICIFSALQLYLDFINIFLYLLRLFGKRR